MKLSSIKQEVEIYSLFKNVDDSILLLNPILKKHGFIFEEHNLLSLEANFANLYSFKESKKTLNYINSDVDNQYSLDFNYHYNMSLFGGPNLEESPKAYFLKSLKNYTVNENYEVINKKDYEIGINMERFTKSLIRKLHLYKNGDIMSPVRFRITKNSKKIISKVIKRTIRPINHQNLIIDSQELLTIENLINKDLEPTSLTELSESFFFNSYEVFDSKIRFINLMTCLESIFNNNTHQIAHTISRHLSIIMSENKAEFNENYNRIKKLYSIRNTIVHGQPFNKKEKLADLIKEVQNLVRFSILYCIENKLTKNDLFNELNSKGF